MTVVVAAAGVAVLIRCCRGCRRRVRCVAACGVMVAMAVIAAAGVAVLLRLCCVGCCCRY